MPLPEHADAVQAIIKELEPKVLGKTRGGITCNCGCVSFPPGVVVAIQPGGSRYPGQEVHWIMWSLILEPQPGETGNNWSCGIDYFVSTDELEELFTRYFGDKEQRKVTELRGYQRYPGPPRQCLSLDEFLAELEAGRL